MAENLQALLGVTIAIWRSRRLWLGHLCQGLGPHELQALLGVDLELGR